MRGEAPYFCSGRAAPVSLWRARDLEVWWKWGQSRAERGAKGGLARPENATGAGPSSEVGDNATRRHSEIAVATLGRRLPHV